MAVTIHIDAVTRATVQQAVSLGTYTASPRIDYSRILQTEATLLWTDQRTVTGSEVLNLAGGLTDVFGTPLTFANLLGFQIRNLSSQNSLIVGTGGSPVLGSDQITVRPLRGVLSDSEHQVSGSAYLLKVAVLPGPSSSSSGSSSSSASPNVSYQIILFGN